MPNPTPSDRILSDVIAAVMVGFGVFGMGYAIWRSHAETADTLVVIEGDGPGGPGGDDDDGEPAAGACGAAEDEGEES